MPKTKKLTLKQQGFIKDYVATNGNGTRAVLNNYDTTDYKTASVMASENLEKPCIREVIEKICKDLNFGVDKAMSKLIDHVNSPQPGTSLKALQTYFDVTGNKAPQKTENETTLKTDITQDQSDKINEAIRKRLTQPTPN